MKGSCHGKETAWVGSLGLLGPVGGRSSIVKGKAGKEKAEGPVSCGKAIRVGMVSFCLFSFFLFYNLLSGNRVRERYLCGYGFFFFFVLLFVFFFFNDVLTWKFVEASKTSVLYIYIDYCLSHLSCHVNCHGSLKVNLFLVNS